MTKADDLGWELEMERYFDERDELRQRVKKNADLYRSDMQYALDLLSDIGSMPAEEDLRDVYEKGRRELQDWRIGEDAGV